MATISIELSKKNKKGLIPVSILIRHGQTKKRIPIEVQLTEKEVKSGKIINRKKSLFVEQMRLKYQAQLDELYENIINWNEMDAETIVDLLTSAKRKRDGIDFFDFAEDWIEHSSVKGIKNYKTLISRLKEFHKRDTLPIKSINYDFLLGFERFLKGKQRAQSLYLGHLRHLFREAMRRYNTGSTPIINNDPFISYRVPKQKLKKGIRALTLEELLKINEYEGRPHSRAQLARDCFILSFCLMGMNSVDLYGCKDLKNEKICYNRAKTKERRSDEAYIEVNVHTFILPLMKKYKSAKKGHIFNFHERYSSPDDFNRALNIGLKEVGRAIGIPTLQFYQARHTFATLSRNLMRFSKGDVDEALNHVGSFDIADIYIAKDFSIINDNNKKLIDKVFSLSLES